MFLNIVRFFLLLPFELLGKTADFIFHPNMDKRNQYRYWDRPSLIGEIVFLRRQLQQERHTYNKKVKELNKDFRRREREFKRRQRLQN